MVNMSHLLPLLFKVEHWLITSLGLKKNQRVWMPLLLMWCSASGEQLRETKSKDTKSRTMEAQWQQEFYRAAASLLPRDAVISPEYGREQGAYGQVDFYISKYQWMVEILREGLALPAHERCFEPGGPYAKLLDNGVKWRVVDFRDTAQNIRRDPHPNTYHVCISGNSTVIHYPDGSIQTVPLLPDKARDAHWNRKPGGTPARLPLSQD